MREGPDQDQGLRRLEGRRRGDGRRAEGLRQGQSWPLQIPRQIAFVADLPKTATGKIQRSSCANWNRDRPSELLVCRDRVARQSASASSTPSSRRPGSGRTGRGAPLLVFLHEGLGSLAMWRDFPQALCDAAGVRGWSGRAPATAARRRARPKPGSGLHAPPGARGAAGALAALGVAEPVWLFGHSDGGLDRCCTPAKFSESAPPAPSCWRRTSWSKTCRWRASPGQTALLNHRPGKQRLVSTTTTRTRPSGAGTASGYPPFKQWSIGTDRVHRPPAAGRAGPGRQYGTLEQIRRGRRPIHFVRTPPETTHF